MSLMEQWLLSKVAFLLVEFTLIPCYSRLPVMLRLYLFLLKSQMAAVSLLRNCKRVNHSEQIVAFVLVSLSVCLSLGQCFF